MELIPAAIKNVRYIKTDSIILFPILQNEFFITFEILSVLILGWSFILKSELCTLIYQRII